MSIDDLDHDEIRNTLRNAIDMGRLEIPKNSDIESILIGLGLIHKKTLLNAAVALYGKSKNLEMSYPQLAIRIARFRGKNRLASFDDNRQYWGNAFR